MIVNPPKSVDLRKSKPTPYAGSAAVRLRRRSLSMSMMGEKSAE